MATTTTNNNSNNVGQHTGNNVAQNRQRLSKMLQLQGYSACREALVLLEDHYTSSAKYDSMEDFIIKLNRTITFDTDAGSSIIDPDLAYLAIKKLCQKTKRQQHVTGDGNDLDHGYDDGDVIVEDEEQPPSPVEVPTTLNIRVKSVQYDQVECQTTATTTTTDGAKEKQAPEFTIHYNFLFKRLNSLPIFQGDFQLMKLATLTASSQPSIRCICFGLLVKDISKIDGYLLIDSTGRVPLRITPDTTFRNRLAYSNCIVLVEGVYVNPDDVLFAANIGLPPILLDPIENKSLACVDEKLVIILKEIYLDEEDVVEAIDMLFTGYNSMEDPPALFILIGDFTRAHCEPSAFRVHMRKLIRILKACDNLKDCHFVFIPGHRDTTLPPTSMDNNDTTITTVLKKTTNIMPKCPLTEEQVPLNHLRASNFYNIHLATNPAHIYLGDRQISVVAHSYLKELRKNLLHDLSDHREELFETAKQILLSNAHLSAGITKVYHSSMNLWHKPDLLILADTEAFGNRYDYSSSSPTDTSFTTVPSFSCQSNQFKVYYVKTGDIEDSQVSSGALNNLEEVEIVETELEHSFDQRVAGDDDEREKLEQKETKTDEEVQLIIDNDD